MLPELGELGKGLPGVLRSLQAAAGMLGSTVMSPHASEAGVFPAAAEVATGKKHRVTEVKCRAVGDEACVHVIEEVGGDA